MPEKTQQLKPDNQQPLPAVQMLWISGHLSTLERLSITSFLRCGHPVHLYTYGLEDSPPQGTQLFDARQILPESCIFKNPSSIGQGSLAPFSDMFRYQLLLKRGGIWCDSDMVCLKPMTFANTMDIFFSSEHAISTVDNKRQLTIKPNIGAIKAPVGSAIIAACLDKASKVNLATAEWAATGPGIVGDILSQHGRSDAVLLPDIFCSVPHWELSTLIAGTRMVNPAAYAIHFWNEIWRWNFLDKDGSYDPLSIYERLKKHYLENSTRKDAS
jgi:hypothetical protein